MPLGEATCERVNKRRPTLERPREISLTRRMCYWLSQYLKTSDAFVVLCTTLSNALLDRLSNILVYKAFQICLAAAEVSQSIQDFAWYSSNARRMWH